MASSLLKINLQLIKTTNNSTQSHPAPTSPLSLSSQTHNFLRHSHLSLSSSNSPNTRKPLSLPIKSSLSSPTPPSSREEAIQQAKNSLSSTLAKPLNNPNLAGKLKRVKQPKLRVEIPVVDDSAESLTQLALEVFGEISLRKKGSLVKIMIFWPSSFLTEAAKKTFSKSSNSIRHIDILSVGETRVLGSADVAVFLAPEAKHLDIMKAVTEDYNPRPVVIFNPQWGFEEERDFDNLSGFLGSFDVVYSFLGLEVRGIFSKRNGVVFRCVRDGIMSGEKWNVLVEENGELKLVTRFDARPSITEVENVLYNLMAVNSPLTKSAKFLKGLVTNVTGKNK